MNLENPDDIKLLSFVKISKNRVKVVKTLENEMLFPSQIAKKVNLRVSQVSSLLKGLKENQLVECINEESKIGRFYRLTEKGKEILKYLE